MKKNEMYENLNEYLVVVSVPGFTKENIEIEIKDLTLYVNFSNNDCFEDGAYKVDETKFKDGKINTNSDLDYDNLIINLDEIVDEKLIKATVENGLLKIELPKETKSTKIEVL